MAVAQAWQYMVAEVGAQDTGWGVGKWAGHYREVLPTQ